MGFRTTKKVWLFLLFVVTMVANSGRAYAQEERFKKAEEFKEKANQRAMIFDSVSGKMVDSIKYSRQFRKQCPIFADTIPLSRMTAISVVVPGFSQLYNRQYWKIPALYASVGTLAVLGFEANNNYKKQQRAYDQALIDKLPRSEVDPIQAKMVDYNTQRTILLTGAAAAYIYFLGDGVMNYVNSGSNVKIATTLSTICPGAGQIYNQTFWKVPIIMGGFSTLGFIIDFNSRGYKRYKKAYNYLTDNNDNTVDEFGGRYPAETLKNTRDAYRRNRDLSIIITAGFYLLNIVDAHVDAQLRDYDVSDDLAVRIEPAVMDLNTLTAGRSQGFGLALKFNF